MSRSRLSRSGISLVEILLVIAIICLLAGILLPIFVRAGAEGRKTKCASNLRRLGEAFKLYLSDWEDTYPGPGGRKGEFNYWSQTNGGGLVPYIRRNGGIGTVWCCPELTGWNGLYPARSYSMNSYLRDPPDVDYPACIGILGGCLENTIEAPGRTILLFEGTPVLRTAPDSAMYVYIRRCGNWTCVRGWFTKEQPLAHVENSWRPWHGGQSNYLYCDGHVRSFRPNVTPNRPKFDASNEWWVQKSVQAAKYGGYD